MGSARQRREKAQRRDVDYEKIREEDLISALMHRSIMSRDDRIEIRLVRRVHTPAGPKIERGPDPRERRGIAGTVGGRSFWRQVLDGRVPSTRATLRGARAHTCRHAIRVDTPYAVGLAHGEKRTRAKTSPGRCNAPRAVESLSDASQFYSVRRKF